MSSKEKLSKYTWEYPKGTADLVEEWEKLKKLDKMVEVSWKEIEEKWKATMPKAYSLPPAYGSGYVTTTTESRHVDSLYSSRDGRLQVGTNDGSTITINIKDDSIEFDGIVITTEMLRNVTKKIKEQEEYETPF